MRSKKILSCALSALMVIGAVSGPGLAQGVSSSRLSGTVTDSQGALIANAEVVVKNSETGVEYKARTGEDGAFLVPSLPVGVYSVTITADGFKQTTVTDVKTILGETVTVAPVLEAGAPSETVTITGGAEVLQKETTTVGATITGRQITELPFTSRDSLDLVLNLPGTNTPGRPRSSSINGLPQGAINITIDGLNVQDNLIRSGDGFFTFIRPRIDAIGEVKTTTGTPGAEAAGDGAAQINFSTKSGTNEFHGGAFWYNRQPGLNSNFYFNNLRGLERDPVRLDQYGFTVGGPIIKDRAFFFFSYDVFDLPEATARTRQILSPDAERGIFKYPGGPGGGVNLLQLAASNGFTGTVDPIIGNLLAAIRESTATGSVANIPTDPARQLFSFTNVGGQKRYFPTTRLDYKVTDKHSVEAIWNYQDFNNGVDFLNTADARFPEPYPNLVGGQNSVRWSFVTALRSQLTSNMVNEARIGFLGGNLIFAGELNPGAYAPLGGAALDSPDDPATAADDDFLSDFWPSPFGQAGSWRNTPVKQFNDNLSWFKGNHNINLGGGFTQISAWQNDPPTVPLIEFGVLDNDPVDAIFNATNFPGATDAILTQAKATYALLTGRVISVANLIASLNENTKEYSLTDPLTQRLRQREFSLYVQDFYRVRPNLTVNVGLRYEYQGPPVNTNGVYSRPTFAGVFGESGQGNFFNPGSLQGAPTQFFEVTKDTELYNPDKNNFAPSIGFAWTPQAKSGLVGRLLGENQTVIRGGYSVSYLRESLSFISQLIGANPGPTIELGLFADSDFEPGSLLYRSGLPQVATPPPPTYPFAFSAGDAAVDIDPNIRVPYVQSYTFGIQRELGRNTVFEARYVGNRSIGQWRRYNVNEVNIFENGFLGEFLNAQRNLQISLAAGAGANFGNQGLPGQVNLPILAASFGSPTSASFRNATNVFRVQSGQAGALANSIAFSASAQARRLAAGFPSNLFIVNPGTLGSGAGGAIAVQNGGASSYNGLQLELRRRLANGLLVQGSYVWSKALTNAFSQSNQNGNNPFRTLRDADIDRGPSPFDITHALKVNWIYELPFGPGRRFDYRGPASSVIGRIIGGWESHGIVRWQSGRPFRLSCGRFTVNGQDSGCDLVGMSIKDLQEALEIRKDPLAATRGTVFYLPQDIIDNTLKAFGLAPGTPTGRYLAPPTAPGQFGSFITLYQPSFFRADLTAAKRIPIRETMNLEFRAEFLNAFNNVNFFVGSPATIAVTVPVNAAAFGQTNQAYQDLSTTNDPGGRLVQLVLRFNF